MMASLGCVVQHWAKFPGFESAPAGLGALSNPAALGGMGALFLGCGVLELGFWSDEAAKEPGNFGDPANFSAEYGAYSKEFRDKEINNGRMAMMAIIGQLSAEAVTGMDAAQQAGLAAVARPRQIQSSSAFVGAASIAPKRLTARRAFDASQEAGVTAPLGYFDPAGFVQDEESFLNLRRAEIKHGRVAMMAALGLLVQSLIKLPGFDSVPAGLGAQWTAPGDAGLWTVVVLCGFFETGLNQWREDPKQPGNFGDPMNLGNYTMEMRNKELNNGRIAMFAVMGIISAEIYTGNVAVAQF
ncbi:unnamed protein product [Effrenium voratum]|nr:unnamed protein product [Effrenium voratum]